jgi:hypothetical protein
VSSAKKYPVLYILDGQWDFKLMDAVLGGLVYDNFAPEMFAGITRSLGNAFQRRELGEESGSVCRMRPWLGYVRAALGCTRRSLMPL